MTTTTTKTTTKTADNAAAVLKEITPEYLNPVEPDDTDLDTLGRDARKASKSGAEAAWTLGRAVVLARVKVQGDREKFAGWVREYIPDIHERTRQRYERVGVLDYKTVRGKTKDEVYRLVFGDDYATGKKGKQRDTTAAVRKKLSKLADDALTAAAGKHGISVPAADLRSFLADILDAVK